MLYEITLLNLDNDEFYEYKIDTFDATHAELEATAKFKRQTKKTENYVFVNSKQI